MTTLTPNPDGCTEFIPNPFKKEKCKNCGHLWNSHEGVISKALLDGYEASIKKAEDAKKAKEEEVKAKARTDKLKKKQQNQAAEDEWFFDGAKEDLSKGLDVDDSDEDDAGGFRMWTGGPLPDDIIPKSSAPAVGLNKVVNLIDFGECDVADEDDFQPPAVEPAAISSNISGGRSNQSLQDLGLPAAGSPPPEPMVAVPTSFARPAAGMEQELLVEIQDLRQMLADANEEKNIQVAIVRDEVVEKQQLVEDLLRQRAEAEVTLRDLRAQLEASKVDSAAAASAAPAAPASQELEQALAEARSAAEAQRAEAERHRSEAARLREEVERLQPLASTAAAPAAAEDATALAKEARAEAERQRGEAEASKAEAERQRCAAEASKAEADRLRAELASFREAPAAPAAGLLAPPKPISVPGSPALSAASAPKSHILRTPGSGNPASAVELAQALKEIRLSAEQQLEWIVHRMRTSTPKATPKGEFGGTKLEGLGAPKMEAA